MTASSTPSTRNLPDVAVIGGGIVGTATAAALSAAGARVVLYEAGPAVAAAASGRNAGEVCHPPDPILGALYHESLERYRALAGEPLPDGDVLRVPADPIGVLELAFDHDLVRRVAASLAERQPDLRPDVLDPAELRRLEPLLAEGLSAFRIATGYPVRPASATAAFASFAVRHGATIETNARARVWTSGGVARGVEVGGRRIAAGSVVVAAGPWTPEIVDPSGAWRPIRPVWGVIVEMHLDPAPGHVMGELIDEATLLLSRPAGEADDRAGARGAAASAGTRPAGSAGDLPAPILGINPAPPRADGSVAPMALGGTLAPAEPDAHRVAPTLVRHAQRFLPSLHEGQAGAVRTCARPQAFDGRPLIGFVPGIEGLVVAAGNGAWGISTGPATGRLAADVVLAGSDAGVPGELRAGRFGSASRG